MRRQVVISANVSELLLEGLIVLYLSPAACHPAIRRLRCVTLKEIIFLSLLIKWNTMLINFPKTEFFVV